MRTELKFILALAVLVGCANCVEDFPATIERCKYDDEECNVKAWNKWNKVAYTSGVPELDIPLSDKHYVDKQVITVGSDLVTLKITFSNLTVYGMAQSTITGVKGFKKNPREMESFQVSGFSPSLNLFGKYDGTGKFLLLQVGGSGNGEIGFYNSTYFVTVYTKVETRDGEDYLVPDKVVTEFESEKYKFVFDNILNNKEITDSINKVVNQNDKLFAEEAKGPAARAFSKVVKRLFTPIFGKYPYRTFFLD
ncbi:uncharacterized protein LOC119069603 [Bradysia coprophila]|uniref:uncharacterized protein LOC119069603 n=1 Tax=Bradysia coprophila TaxID=38358 RepID=UPI00187DA7D1|nr:uncharacterized protein LOC119069603 [Bradysia coprophila]